MPFKTCRASCSLRRGPLARRHRSQRGHQQVQLLDLHQVARLVRMFVKPDRFRLLAGAEAQAEYQWTPAGRPAPFLHYHFCRTCGVRVFGWGEHESMGGRFLLCLDRFARRRRPRPLRGRADQMRRRPPRSFRSTARGHSHYVRLRRPPTARAPPPASADDRLGRRTSSSWRARV